MGNTLGPVSEKLGKSGKNAAQKMTFFFKDFFSK